MTSPLARKYSCKDEELPVICNFVVFSFKRDLADFTAYSTKFKPNYPDDFETNIAKVFDVVEPQSEIQQQKIITERIFETLDGLTDLVNRLAGYIKFSHLEHIDFGLTQLRKAIKVKDAEGAIKSLHTVSSNISNFKEALVKQGLTDDLEAQFAASSRAITEDKQKQYEIFSNRKSTVQNNLGLLNGLFDQLTEVLTAGKILYKANDPAKLQEYTFEDLKKRVRRTSKPANGDNAPATNEK